MLSKTLAFRLVRCLVALWLGLAPVIAAAQICHEGSIARSLAAADEDDGCAFVVSVTCVPNCEQSPLKPQKDGAWLLQTSAELGLESGLSEWAPPPPKASSRQRTLLEPRQVPSIAVLKCSFLK